MCMNNLRLCTHVCLFFFFVCLERLVCVPMIWELLIGHVWITVFVAVAPLRAPLVILHVLELL